MVVCELLNVFYFVLEDGCFTSVNMIDKDIVFKYVKFSLLGQDELQTLSVFITLVRSLWRKGLHLLSLLNQHLAADIILTVVSTQCAHHTFDLINSILVFIY